MDSPRYEIKVSEEQKYFTNHTLWDELNSTTSLIKQNDILHGSLIPCQGGRQVVLLLDPERFEKDQIYFIAMKAYDENDMDSGVSNFGQILRSNIFRPYDVDDSKLSGGDITWIFFGCVYIFGGLLIVVGYLIYQKFPTKELTEKFQRNKKQKDEEAPKKEVSTTEIDTTVVTSTTVYRSTN